MFVAWGTVVMAMFLEVVFRNGLGMVTASDSGFLSLLIAHHLSGDGDTMEMLEAGVATAAGGYNKTVSASGAKGNRRRR